MNVLISISVTDDFVIALLVGGKVRFRWLELEGEKQVFSALEILFLSLYKGCDLHCYNTPNEKIVVNSSIQF